MEQCEAMAARKQPNPIDIHVGSRLKLRRTMVGLTQEKLGDQLGVTFQQVQKYEKGANRIGASRLQEIASILSVPVSYFFEEAKSVSQEPEAEFGFAEDQRGSFQISRSSPGESHALAKAFERISDARIRRRIIDLVETLADSEHH